MSNFKEIHEEFRGRRVAIHNTKLSEKQLWGISAKAGIAALLLAGMSHLPLGLAKPLANDALHRIDQPSLSTANETLALSEIAGVVALTGFSLSLFGLSVEHLGVLLAAARKPGEDSITDSPTPNVE